MQSRLTRVATAGTLLIFIGISTAFAGSVTAWDLGSGFGFSYAFGDAAGSNGIVGTTLAAV
jgi:hypothetical protein